MKRLLKKIFTDERGQTLPIVLVVLAMGSLTITPALQRATTHMKTTVLMKSNFRGTCAAEAGVETALWSMLHSQQIPTSISGGLNNLSVGIAAVDEGLHTVYLGELIPASSHTSYLSVDGQAIWDATAQKYKYVITVTWQEGSTTIHLSGIGARLPDGYAYQAGSAALFSENLSTAEPTLQTEPNGAQMANWQFSPPLPKVTSSNRVKTETFYITGSGTPASDYGWVVANREDIGQIGEITGMMYNIVAIATDPTTGRICAKITVDAVNMGTSVKIVNWQVTN